MLRVTQSQLVWTLWFWWVIATGVCGTIGWVLPLVSLLNWELYDFSDDNLIFPLLVLGCEWLIVAGPLLGIGQGLVLRYLLGYKQWWRWILASTVGIILGGIVIVASRPGVLLASGFIGIGTLLAGAALGTAQWGILSDCAKEAGWRGETRWWIPANSLAAGISLIVSPLAVSIFIPHTFQNLYSLALLSPIAQIRMEAISRWFVGWIISTLVFGAITGFILSRLARCATLRSREID